MNSLFLLSRGSPESPGYFVEVEQLRLWVQYKENWQLETEILRRDTNKIQLFAAQCTALSDTFQQA